MVGATDVVQPWMPRAAQARDACPWHVSRVGGARRRGCAAAGVSVFLNEPSGDAVRSRASPVTIHSSVRRRILPAALPDLRVPGRRALVVVPDPVPLDPVA